MARQKHGSTSGDLLRREFGVGVSVRTVGRCLQQWGLTPQKPPTRASEQNAAAVRRRRYFEAASVRYAAA